MTTVKIKTKKGCIVSVECEGHTGYAEHGEDIVCAALSSIVQTAVLGVLQIAGVAAEYRTDEKKGCLFLKIPDDISFLSVQREKCNVILDTMLLGIKDLHETFSDFIDLEIE